MKFVSLFSFIALILTSTQALAERSARRPSSDQSVVDESGEKPWWSPEKQRFSIGYEGAGVPSVLPRNLIVMGFLVGDDLFFEAYAGIAKAADSFNTSTTTAENTIATTRTITMANAGQKNPFSFALGAGLRYRVFQNSWFQFSVGGLIAVVPGFSSNYPTGSSTQTIPNTATPDTYTQVDTALGTVDVKTGTSISLGPKLQTEFYLKWFPHLALGFATGILATFNGDVTTTTDTTTQTFNVNAGTPAAPAPHTTSTTSTVAKPGTSGNTFGIGGTQFQFTGLFTIRYIW